MSKSRGCLERFTVTHKQSAAMMRARQASIDANGRQCWTGQWEWIRTFNYNWNKRPTQCCNEKRPLVKREDNATDIETLKAGFGW